MSHNKKLTAVGQLMDEEKQQPGAARIIQQPQAGFRWQRGVLGLVTALCIAGVSACSSNYVIKATDGTVYHTQGAPSLQGGAYNFVDADGRQQQVFLSNVQQVEKR